MNIKEEINGFVKKYGKQCPNCEGRCIVNYGRPSNLTGEYYDDCPICHGTGKIIVPK